MSIERIKELPRNKSVDTHGHDLDCREDQENRIENSQSHKEMPRMFE